MISIIVPTYNHASSLKITISSIISQTNTKWNLIIIDDGSTDETEKVVQAYLKDSRIQYYFQSNQGVSAARNLGIQKAKGEFVIFLDSDDYVKDNLIERLHQENYFSYDFVTWNVLKIKNKIESIVKPENLGALYSFKELLFLAGSICIKKELFVQVGGYDPHLKFGENYELGLRLSRIPGTLVNYIPEELGVFHECGNRTSNSLNNILHSNLYQYKKHEEIFNELPLVKYSILYRIAFLYQQLGEIKLAENFYINAIKIRPLNYKAWLRLIQNKLVKVE